MTEGWLFYFLGDHTKKGDQWSPLRTVVIPFFLISKAPSVTKMTTNGRPYEQWLFHFLYRKCYSIQKGDQESPLRIIFFELPSTKKGDLWSPLRTVVIPFFISEMLFNSKGRPMIAPTNSIFLNYRLPKKATGGRPYNQSFFLNVNIFINTNVTGTPIIAAIA